MECLSVIGILGEEFSNRFYGMRSHTYNQLISVCSSILLRSDVDHDNLAADLQMGAIKLQADDELILLDPRHLCDFPFYISKKN